MILENLDFELLNEQVSHLEKIGDGYVYDVPIITLINAHCKCKHWWNVTDEESKTVWNAVLLLRQFGSVAPNRFHTRNLIDSLLIGSFHFIFDGTNIFKDSKIYNKPRWNVLVNISKRQCCHVLGCIRDLDGADRAKTVRKGMIEEFMPIRIWQRQIQIPD